MNEPDFTPSNLHYRFQKFEYLDLLNASEIYVGDPASFNDPLDLRLSIENLTLRGPFGDEQRLRQAMEYLIDGNAELQNHWFYDDSLIRALNEWVDGALPAIELIGEVQRRFRKFGIVCVSPHWNVPLMWAHYAGSHRGFCIEYAVTNVADARNAKFGLYRVQYSTSLPTLCLSEVLFSPHQTMQRMLATKHVDWAYEKESRLIHFAKKGCQVKLPHGTHITRLIGGLGMLPSDVVTLTKTAARLNVGAARVKQSEGYEMRLVNL